MQRAALVWGPGAVQSSQHMELLIAAQLLFMMVPIARMQPCVGESVVKRVVLGAPLVAFVCMVIQSCLPVREATCSNGTSHFELVRMSGQACLGVDHFYL